MVGYDPLNRLDVRPGEGRSLRELLDVWRDGGSMTETERARFHAAKGNPDFWPLVGPPAEHKPATPPPSPGTPPPGSLLTFDATKLSAEEWARWRKEHGV